MEQFTQRSQLDASALDVYTWHERAGAFTRLLPPYVRARIIKAPERIALGERAIVELRWGATRLYMESQIVESDPPHMFADAQIKGPFARFRHAHRFAPAGHSGCLLEDQIDYALPLGALGQGVAGAAIRRELARGFAWRHARTRLDIARHMRYAGKPLRIGVTGASGLIGSALCAFLSSGGHEVWRFVRTGTPQRFSALPERSIAWDPPRGVIDVKALEGLDALVNLAGANLGAGRWTSARLAEINASREQATALLAGALARLKHPPRVLVNASAVGYYGDRGGELLTEESAAGAGLLAEVCQRWEQAARIAERGGTRVVLLRQGVVLTARGGALARLLPVFRSGLGGVLGGGAQYMSWIALDDALGAILHALYTEELSGPLNAVAPQPLTNAEFTNALAAVLGRAAPWRVPAPALQLGLGALAHELLLSSQRVAPQRLEQSGFQFHFPALKDALRFELGL